MLDNKGQSLVLFIVFFPLMLIVLILVLDVGRVITQKQELDNINKIVVNYGLDNLNDETLNDSSIELVKLNNDKIEVIYMDMVDEKIYSKLGIKAKSVLSGLVNISIFDKIDIEFTFVSQVLIKNI